MVLSRTSTGRVILVPTQLRFDRWFLPLAVPLGLGPKNSELWVGAGSLHVKMGWAFAADIPLTSITKAEATNARVYAAGVHFGFGRWLVNDMGPVARYLGPLVPKQTLLWQDPVPAVSHDLVGEAEIASLKSQILASGLTVSQLVSTAWAAASSFRGSDKRGGANGGRIRLQPQVGWEVNDPDGDLRKVIRTLEEIQESFNSAAPGNIKVSFADLVVLGGCAAIEKAAKAAGHNITVPFTPGRTDASQEQTDVESFAVLEPKADGFRNYLGKGNPLPAEYMLLDKANLLTLSAPEMTVLVGGLRVLGANYKRLPLGVFTEASESLTNDFFVNLLDMGITWEPSPADDGTYQGKDGSGKVKWTGSRVDLVFGSNSELRALVEVYGADDAQPKFVQDFVAAWDKVMNLDRFDVR